MKVTIDNNAGFCWGVVRTIDLAEETLGKSNDPQKEVYVLGHIIHNPKEIERLENKGLKTITHEDFEQIAQNPNAKVIVRAHGEPPSTYKKAGDLGLEIVDATCPLVDNLQNRVRKYYEQGFQIIIFGKREHPEIVGLRGVCNDECIIIRTPDEAREIDTFGEKIALISQTTMYKQQFTEIKEYLSGKVGELHDLGSAANLVARDTTCRAVTHREEPLVEYAKANDVLIFVSGKKSSNGKALYTACKSVNPRSHFIEDISELDWDWFDGAESVGISGATSTPQWYMERVKAKIEEKFNHADQPA